MSGIDLIMLALIVLTALAGLRRGLVVGVFSLLGLAVGIYLGASFGPRLVGGHGGQWLPLVALAGAMVCAGIGQTVGVMFGRHLRTGLLVLGPLRLLDSIGGAFLGLATGLILCWAIGAVFLYVPGQTRLRHYAQQSRFFSHLNRELPPGRLIDALAHIDPFSTLAGPAANVDPPDPAVLDSAGVNRAATSVVRVIGNACGLGIEGSGWVAGPGIVVTNADVVAGVSAPEVDRNDGKLLPASVVSFDQLNDVAVLRVAGLRATPLPIGEANAGSAAGMLGYPQNGPFAETAVRVGHTARILGRDAYGNFPVSRNVTTIRGTIRSGNSGGPVVDADGRVITMVFARRIGSDGGYGVPTPSIRAALARAGTESLATRCVAR